MTSHYMLPIVLTKSTYSFDKGIKPDSDPFLESPANLQETQRTQKHVGLCHECEISKPQTMGNYRYYSLSSSRDKLSRKERDGD